MFLLSMKGGRQLWAGFKGYLLINEFESEFVSTTASDMDSNYLDIDDILSTSIKVTCKMKHPVHKLGFIDATGDCENLEKDTKLELPLWLAKEFYECDLTSVELPKGFNDLYRQVLEADPSVVNLQKLGPNFYRTGRFLSYMNMPESQAISLSLVNTFYHRIRKLMDYSTNMTISITPGKFILLQFVTNEAFL